MWLVLGEIGMALAALWALAPRMETGRVENGEEAGDECG
jgi:hypothetical protein